MSLNEADLCFQEVIVKTCPVLKNNHPHLITVHQLSYFIIQIPSNNDKAIRLSIQDFKEQNNNLPFQLKGSAPIELENEEVIDRIQEKSK